MLISNSFTTTEHVKKNCLSSGPTSDNMVMLESADFCAGMGIPNDSEGLLIMNFLGCVGFARRMETADKYVQARLTQ
jgi:hypothetical protein